MIVVINGSFGVGKTTVAKLIRRSLPGSAIYDPEWVGFVLRRFECVEAHNDPHFGEPVDTENRSAREVAEDIIKRLQRPIL
jgi:broad-specificity NMP kinase